jgi:membrane protein
LNDVKPVINQLLWLRAFGQHLWAHFLDDRCFEAAGSLSYKTLIALVPLLAVMIGVVSAFGLFDEWIGRVETYLFAHFVPAKGAEIQAYLRQFVERTSGLTGAGSLVLVIIAILLMHTIEQSFNRIWRVRRPRSWTNRFVMYWAVLTLGPVLLGASVVLTSYFAILSVNAPVVLQHAVESFLARAAPFLIAWLGFGVMFVVVPHRRVLLKHAVVGALLSAVLFELAKGAFVLYLTVSTTYEHLYGALAIIPIFLLWIYVLWVVVLLGASLTAALTTFRASQGVSQWSEAFRFVLLLRIIRHLYVAQTQSDPLTVPQLHNLEPWATDQALHDLLATLEHHGMVTFDEDGRVVLCADLDDWSLADLYRLDFFVFPLDGLADYPRRDALDDRIATFFESLTSGWGPMKQSVKAVLLTPTQEPS